MTSGSTASMSSSTGSHHRASTSRSGSDGEVGRLPETVDRVAYRVIQEALTNAHMHGSEQVREWTAAARLGVRLDAGI